MSKSEFEKRLDAIVEDALKRLADKIKALVSKKDNPNE